MGSVDGCVDGSIVCGAEYSGHEWSHKYNRNFVITNRSPIAVYTTTSSNTVDIAAVVKVIVLEQLNPESCDGTQE